MNLETYQASIAGRVMDLTYMEYELLRFLATNPNRVFTRETLLSRVWGYEYYGGARTVDVHVRRLRAKFGEENAHLIQTVRSVGYKFGIDAERARRLGRAARRPRVRPRRERAERQLVDRDRRARRARLARRPRIHTSLHAAKSAMSIKNSVALTTWSNVAPASASTSRALTSAWRSCSARRAVDDRGRRHPRAPPRAGPR